MIDAVEHRQDLEARLKQQFGRDIVFDRKYGKKAEPKLDASSPFGLFKFWGELLGASRPAESKKPAIGIVYVEGPIMAGRPGSVAVPGVGRVQLGDPQGAGRRGQPTTRSRPWCCASIRRAARPWPARSSSTPPAA